MKLLKAQQQNPKKIILEISKIHYIKSMTPLKELLDGEDLRNPIEVRQHTYSLTLEKVLVVNPMQKNNIQFLEEVRECRH